MGEYILRPTKYNYQSGYQYASSSYPTENAYDNNSDTYWICNNNTLNYDKYERTLHGFDFSVIPNNEIISEMYVGLIHYNSRASTNFRVFPVSGLVTSQPYPPTALEDFGNFTNYVTFNNSTASTILDELSNENLPNSIEYINQNKAEIIAGTKRYGLFVTFRNGAISRIYDIYLKIKTVKTGSLIYSGDKNITSAYLGSTPINSIYLGSQKLL